MNIFRLKEFLKYRHAARGRHGLHSPAVYHFVDAALRPGARRFKDGISYTSAAGVAWQPDALLRRIIHHFRFGEIIRHGADGSAQTFRPVFPQSGDSDAAYSGRLIIWPGPEAVDKALMKACRGNDVVALSRIHHTPAAVAAWAALCGETDIRCSIDLFELGLLLFSDEFKERQHFVLRYPV